jgi:Ca2+-transporting ATPase
MLWVNLIMDTFGAMALSSLPPTERVMKDRPRDRNAFILNRSMLANIIGVGGFFFLMLTAFLYIFQHADVERMSDLLCIRIGGRNGVTPYELTLLFSIFVWTHFWYLFNARGYKSGGSGLQLKGCNGFLTIAAVIVAGQVLIVEVLYDFFNVVPMKWQDWLIIVAGSSLVVWVREAFRLLFHPHR